ncbi:hypothetical protein D3C78_1575500 [compost metagenome]
MESVSSVTVSFSGAGVVDSEPFGAVVSVSDPDAGLLLLKSLLSLFNISDRFCPFRLFPCCITYLKLDPEKSYLTTACLVKSETLDGAAIVGPAAKTGVKAIAPAITSFFETFFISWNLSLCSLRG